MDGSRIYRLLRLITLLQSGRKYTANELAAEFEVSRRTVFRDLNMLELAHIPYYFDARSGGYTIGSHFFLPPVNLTLTEALAVLMLAGGPKGATRIPLLSEGAKAAIKLESALPGPIREYVGSIMDHVSVNVGPVSRHEGLEGLFEQLAAAIAHRKVCRMVYLSFEKRRQLEVEIHPLRLLFLNRAWYLIAWSVPDRETRTFKLGRIARLTPLRRTFEMPPGGLPENPFGRAWSMIPEGRLYDVHLHFLPKVAGNVAEVQWHRDQRVEWRDDGAIDFRVTVDGLNEITWWILGYGDQVEVLAPAPLRKRIAAVAQAVLRKYQEV